MKRIGLAVGLLLVGACSKGQEAETQPEPPPTPKPEVAKPPPPPMTEAQVAIVVESARKANATIEASNAVKVPKDRKGLPHWDVYVEQQLKLDRDLREVFDEKSAERLLREHPDHPEEALVRKTLHRVQLAYVRSDDIFAEAEFWQQAKSLDAQRERADWFTRYQVLNQNLIRSHEQTIHKLNLLSPGLGADEKANRERANGLRVDLYKSIASSEKEIRRIGPSVEREKFVVQGGIDVTAKQLWKDFDANEIAALQKYKGKQVRLSGKVARVSADIMDKPQIHLRTPNSFEQVLIHGAPTGQAAKLRKGDEIEVICVRISEVLGSPVCDMQ